MIEARGIVAVENTLSEDTIRGTFLPKQNFTETLRKLCISSTLINLFSTKNLELYVEIHLQSHGDKSGNTKTEESILLMSLK